MFYISLQRKSVSYPEMVILVYQKCIKLVYQISVSKNPIINLVKKQPNINQQNYQL